MLIRPGQRSDAAAILSLIKELAVFEKEPEAVLVTQNDIENDGFGDKPQFKTFIAEYDHEIVGMALFYNRYSTWKGTTIHLEDLIVKEKMRGKGVGLALYKKVMEQAQEDGVRRVEWAVLDWNKPAVDFYEKSGATVLSDWRVVQMTDVAIAHFLDKL